MSGEPWGRSKEPNGYIIPAIELGYRLGKLLIIVVGQDRHEDLFQLQIANLYYHHVFNHI